jgi:hypothetical protein
MSTLSRAEWQASVTQHRERRAAVAAARELLNQPVSGQLDLEQLLLELATLKREVADLRRPVRERVKAAARKVLRA